MFGWERAVIYSAQYGFPIGNVWIECAKHFNENILKIFSGQAVLQMSKISGSCVIASVNYAPINIKPHYPPPRRTRGNSGGFDPI